QPHRAETWVRREHAPGSRAQRTHDGASLGSHFSELAHGTVDLLRKEVELAKSEVREALEQTKRGVAGVVAGATVLAGGFAALLAAAILGLGLYLPYWAAALIVGGAACAVGAVLLGAGKGVVAPANFIPHRTMAEHDRDKQMLKEHL